MRGGHSGILFQATEDTALVFSQLIKIRFSDLISDLISDPISDLIIGHIFSIKGIGVVQRNNNFKDIALYDAGILSRIPFAILIQVSGAGTEFVRISYLIEKAAISGFLGTGDRFSGVISPILKARQAFSTYI